MSLTNAFPSLDCGLMPTLLTALEQAIRKASAHHQGEVAPPVCLLWPDPHGQWAEGPCGGSRSSALS
jgi:hypothetical protein